VDVHREVTARLIAGWRALRRTWLPVAQMSVAAGLAWLVAHDLLHHQRAFFAPVAAVIALGLAPGQRIHRAVEMVIGVALGVFVGDLLIGQIGSGTWQIMLVVLLAVSLTILIGGGPLAVSQAAGSAVLVATLVPPTNGIYSTRIADAAVGGVVGIAILVVAPGNLVKSVRRAAQPVFVELSKVLDEIAAAIESRDAKRADAALQHARSSEGTVRALLAQLDLALESARLAPLHWRERETLERYAVAATYLELAIRDARVLARAAVRLVELEVPPPELADAIRELARSVAKIEGELESGGHDSGVLAADAAMRATLVLEAQSGLAVSAVVAQVRSTATDLLRARGVERAEAVRRVRATGI
jgi:uncharacterized membrane protein YgaE (UPF0421/DUF939 family)